MEPATVPLTGPSDRFVTSTEKVIVYDLRSEYGFNIALYTFEDKVPVNLYDGELVIDFTEIKRALQKVTP